MATARENLGSLEETPAPAAAYIRAKGAAVLTAQLRMVKNRPPFSPRTPER